MMKNSLLRIILLCAFLFFSCEKKKPIKKIKPTYPTSGVVITFDDTTVSEWFDADKKLSKYNWKATFCVSKINTLNLSEVTQLVALQNKGHEIAGHGLNHLDAPKFVAENGSDSYINQEITPMLDLMHFYSFKVSSFAYPFGSRNKKTDEVLLTKFKIIRGLTYGARTPSFQNCYYNNTKLVYGIEIDDNHPKFNIPYLLKLLDYAQQNHKILILVGHKPELKIAANYQIKIETLKLICRYVKQHRMKFCTLSDLNHLKYDIVMLQQQMY